MVKKDTGGGEKRPVVAGVDCPESGPGPHGPGSRLD